MKKFLYFLYYGVFLFLSVDIVYNLYIYLFKEISLFLSVVSAVSVLSVFGLFKIIEDFIFEKSSVKAEVKPSKPKTAVPETPKTKKPSKPKTAVSETPKTKKPSKPKTEKPEHTASGYVCKNCGHKNVLGASDPKICAYCGRNPEVKDNFVVCKQCGMENPVEKSGFRKKENKKCIICGGKL